jgi:hypothetical protein
MIIFSRVASNILSGESRIRRNCALSMEDFCDDCVLVQSCQLTGRNTRVDLDGEIYLIFWSSLTGRMRMVYLTVWERTLDREIKGAVSDLLYELTRFFHESAAVESSGFYSYGSLFPFLTKVYRKICFPGAFVGMKSRVFQG